MGICADERDYDYEKPNRRRTRTRTKKTAKRLGYVVSPEPATVVASLEASSPSPSRVFRSNPTQHPHRLDSLQGQSNLIGNMLRQVALATPAGDGEGQGARPLGISRRPLRECLRGFGPSNKPKLARISPSLAGMA